MRFSVDYGRVKDFAGELEDAPRLIEAELPRVVERGAYNVRRDARRYVRASSRGKYLKHYPRSITYDTESGDGWAQADIGPEVDRPQGGMGRGVEFGSRNTAPTPHLFPAYEEELPRLQRYLGTVARRALR